MRPMMPNPDYSAKSAGTSFNPDSYASLNSQRNILPESVGPDFKSCCIG